MLCLPVRFYANVVFRSYNGMTSLRYRIAHLGS